MRESCIPFGHRTVSNTGYSYTHLVKELIQEDVEEPARWVESWCNVAHIACEEAGLPKSCSSVNALSS